MTVVELVRHAKAFPREQWWGKAERERPLTASGFVQSRRLALLLHGQGTIDGFYSSPFVRCVQTLEPLAELVGGKIVPEPGLGEATTLRVHDGGDSWIVSAWLGGRAVAVIDRVVEEHAGGRIVLCSHGDVIPAVMALLVGRDGADLDNVRCRKGGRFTLEFDGAVCAGITPSPPP